MHESLSRARYRRIATSNYVADIYPMQVMSPNPLDPHAPDWLTKWRDAWEAGASSAMNRKTTKIVTLTDASSKKAMWWLPGMVSTVLEPRTSMSGYGIFGHLWIQKSSSTKQGLDKIHLELASTFAENLLVSFASIQVQQLEEIEWLSQALVFGLEDAMEWLAMKDQQTLSRWAGGADLVFRRLAETSPYAKTTTRILGYLSADLTDSRDFPLPPSRALHCTRRYIATTLCIAIMLKGESARNGNISPLRI